MEQAYRKGNLDIKLRPALVSRWARSCGDISSPAHIEDVGKFGEEWRAWYRSLLPKSRVGRKSWPPLKKAPADALEWDDLQKGSKGGFVILLVSLSWWMAQAATKKDKDTLSAVLKEVLFCVRQLAAKAAEDDSSNLHKCSQGPGTRQLSAKRYLQMFCYSSPLI